MHSKIAIITARGGSKRIPRKNIKEFQGKPIIVYSIQAALESNLFDEVMVSTDDQEILAIAEEAGARVPFLRSDKNSSDFATTKEVLIEVLENYSQQGRNFDSFCCIYPTAPFVTAHKLRQSFTFLHDQNADAVISVCKFSFPIQRAFKVQDSCLTMFQPEYSQVRSQDLEPAYHDAGQFYWLKTSAFFEQNSIFAKKTLPFVLPETEVQDIDNLVDWKIAEIKYEFMLRNST